MSIPEKYLFLAVTPPVQPSADIQGPGGCGRGTEPADSSQQQDRAPLLEDCLPALEGLDSQQRPQCTARCRGICVRTNVPARHCD
eukprot:2865810-Rhodomonas_salina.1